MLILCDIWPSVMCNPFCRIYWIITIAFIQFCYYRYFITHIYSAELLDLVDYLCSFLGNIKVIIKLIVFWLNQR